MTLGAGGGEDGWKSAVHSQSTEEGKSYRGNAKMNSSGRGNPECNHSPVVFFLCKINLLKKLITEGISFDIRTHSRAQTICDAVGRAKSQIIFFLDTGLSAALLASGSLIFLTYKMGILICH